MRASIRKYRAEEKKKWYLNKKWELWNKILNISREIKGIKKVPANKNPYL